MISMLQKLKVYVDDKYLGQETMSCENGIFSSNRHFLGPRMFLLCMDGMPSSVCESG
jgi:hypothetical protein